MVFDGDQHDGFGSVVPVLYQDLLVELVVILEVPVHLVVELLVILNEAQIKHKQISYPLRKCQLTYLLIELLNLFTHLHPVSSNLVKFLEVWVIFIQHRPKLQVCEGCLLKLLKYLLLEVGEVEL